MYELLIFYVIFSAGAAFFSSLLHYSIRRDKIFGGWQHVLDWIYSKEKLRPFGKPLGDCYLCFSHLLGCIFFAVFCIFSNNILGVWITNTDTSLFVSVPVNIFFAYIFISFSVFLALKVAMKEDKKDNKDV